MARQESRRVRDFRRVENAAADPEGLVEEVQPERVDPAQQPRGSRRQAEGVRRRARQ